MENFKTWQEYYEKMKAGTADAVGGFKERSDDVIGSFKSRSDDMLDGFKKGYAAAKEKTQGIFDREYSPLEKGLILGGILAVGILIGVGISGCRRCRRRKNEEEKEEE